MHPFLVLVTIGGLVLLGLVIGTFVVSLQTRDAVWSMSANQVSLGLTADETIALAAYRTFSTLATDISGDDHTPLAPGETGRGYGAHLGPLRAARAMAIVHIAMSDSVAAGTRAFRPYSASVAFVDEASPASVPAALAIAAHDTLLWLYPAYRTRIERVTLGYLAGMADTDTKQRGVELGSVAAEAIIRARTGDGSAHDEPSVENYSSNIPGRWRQDPVSKIPIALGGLWAERVKPFVIKRANQFRIIPPPTLNSSMYAMEFYEAKCLGADGVKSTTVRDEWRTFVGNFWAYDGSPSLCAPPRMYNQFGRTVARTAGFGLVQTARTLGLVNVVMADAGLSSWDSKYHYLRERPVTAIRTSAPFDDNPNTVQDAHWEPLGAPASNSADPNFTPPFPAYPSGHAVYGGGAMEVLRSLLGNDTFTFTFISDEYNGQTSGSGSSAVTRPYTPRTFSSFTEVEDENGQSRIYLGIHWASDKTFGIPQGREVARYIIERVYTEMKQ